MDKWSDFETHPVGTAKRIEELEAKLAKAVAIAKDAIETMECGPFFPDQEGQRLLADLATLKGQDDE